MADPQALVVAVAAAHAVEHVGPARGPAQPRPGRRPPGHRAQEQPAALAIWNGARRRARRRRGRGPGAPARRPLPGGASSGTARVRVPSRPRGGWVDQQYLPDALVGRTGTSRPRRTASRRRSAPVAARRGRRPAQRDPSVARRAADDHRRGPSGDGHARDDLERFDRVLGSAEAIGDAMAGSGRVARTALSAPMIKAPVWRPGPRARCAGCAGRGDGGRRWSGYRGRPPSPDDRRNRRRA
jgi:hypothetical protein